MTLPDYEQRVADLQTLVEKADTACEDKVKAEAAQTKAAQTERDLYVEKNKVCEAALKQATKKRSGGCWLKKIFSFGISGCH